MAKNLSNLSGTAKSTAHAANEIVDDRQVINNAGGAVYEVDDFSRLNRFLILGSESNTYYQTGKQLSVENAKNIQKLLKTKKNGLKAIDEAVRVSVEGIAPKNDSAIFVIALGCASENVDVRSYAFKAISKVCRIPTHLFTLIAYVQSMRGWGKGFQKAIAGWYNNKPDHILATHVCKYASRALEGELPWSHRDVIRLAHIKPLSESHSLLYKYATKGWDNLSDSEKLTIQNGNLRYIYGHEMAKKCDNAKDVVKLINQYDLSHESIPTEIKNSHVVYDALVKNMPMTATIRNLATMTKVGTLAPLSDNVSLVTDRLTNEESLKKARIHPLNVLAALKTYNAGRGFKGTNTWTPIPQIVSALNDAFYKSFSFVEPTGKRILIALDVSGSMYSGCCSGIESLTPAEGVAAMAMAIARTEKNYHIVGFSHNIVNVPINAKTSLEDALKVMSNIPMGATDCSLPMSYAIDKNLKVDAFIVLTDSETWVSGKYGQPTETLRKYRKVSGIHDAKLIVGATTSTGFTIADPKDKGMLDIAGFGSDVPQIVSEFIRGNI